MASKTPKRKFAQKVYDRVREMTAAGSSVDEVTLDILGPNAPKARQKSLRQTIHNIRHQMKKMGTVKAPAKRKAKKTVKASSLMKRMRELNNLVVEISESNDNIHVSTVRRKGMLSIEIHDLNIFEMSSVVEGR